METCDLEAIQKAMGTVQYDSDLYERVSTFRDLLELSDPATDRLWNLLTRAYLMGENHAKNKCPGKSWGRSEPNDHP
jgi:hypothetical protein